MLGRDGPPLPVHAAYQTYVDPRQQSLDKQTVAWLMWRCLWQHDSCHSRSVSRESWQTMDQSPTAGSRSAFAGHAAAGVRRLQDCGRRCACVS